jgi:hypothetical protein
MLDVFGQLTEATRPAEPPPCLRIEPIPGRAEVTSEKRSKPLVRRRAGAVGSPSFVTNVSTDKPLQAARASQAGYRVTRRRPACPSMSPATASGCIGRHDYRCACNDRGCRPVGVLRRCQIARQTRSWSLSRTATFQSPPYQGHAGTALRKGASPLVAYPPAPAPPRCCRSSSSRPLSRSVTSLPPLATSTTRGRSSLR